MAFFEHQEGKYFAQSKELLNKLTWSYNNELDLDYNFNYRLISRGIPIFLQKIMILKINLNNIMD